MYVINEPCHINDTTHRCAIRYILKNTVVFLQCFSGCICFEQCSSRCTTVFFRMQDVYNSAHCVCYIIYIPKNILKNTVLVCDVTHSHV